MAAIKGTDSASVRAQNAKVSFSKGIMSCSSLASGRALIVRCHYIRANTRAVTGEILACFDAKVDTTRIFHDRN